MRRDAEIIVTRDGTWPTVWRWQTEIVAQITDAAGAMTAKRHMLFGYALTKNRAFKLARKAQETAEVGR